MIVRKNTLAALGLLLLVFTFAALPANAQGKEYSSIVNHLKTKYQAKKVKIPFMWLARFAVRIVRPAGVKSFSLTMFENLQFSRPTLNQEMQLAMRNSFGADWIPIFHVRSREGQQVYMYMREDGKDVKMTLVTIDKNQAAVVRAKFNPDKLADFIDNPKIFGISLEDKKAQADHQPEISEPKEVSAAVEKKEN